MLAVIGLYCRCGENVAAFPISTTDLTGEWNQRILRINNALQDHQSECPIYRSLQPLTTPPAAE